jgi:hypothetical protein
MLERPYKRRGGCVSQFFQGLRCRSMHAWEIAGYRINQGIRSLAISSLT